MSTFRFVSNECLIFQPISGKQSLKRVAEQGLAVAVVLELGSLSHARQAQRLKLCPDLLPAGEGFLTVPTRAAYRVD